MKGVYVFNLSTHFGSRRHFAEDTVPLYLQNAKNDKNIFSRFSQFLKNETT